MIDWFIIYGILAGLLYRALLAEQATASPPTQGLQETLIRLVFGHADPTLVEVLRAYTATILLNLADTRDHLRPQRPRKDS